MMEIDETRLELNTTRMTLTLKSNLVNSAIHVRIAEKSLKFVFLVDLKTKMAALINDCPSHFLGNCWTKFDNTVQEASTQPPLPSVVLPLLFMLYIFAYL